MAVASDQKKSTISSAASPRPTKQALPAPASSHLVMPANVRAGQIVGVVEVIGGLGSAIDIPHLADELGGDLATFLPILDTAEMLGLVKIEKGDVSLTDFGAKFQKSAKKKVRILKDTLAQIEPFKTALELISKKKAVSAHEIAQALEAKGCRWHHSSELNETLIGALLIHWAIYAELLRFNGKTEKFHKF